MYQAWRRVSRSGSQMTGAGFVVPATGGGGGGSSLLTGLAASWKLADLSDSSGNGHALTNNNSVSFANAGMTGNCATFVAASSKYLSLASHADVQMGNNDFTLACAVSLASKSARMQIVAKDVDTGGTNNREYELFYDQSADRFSFGFFDASLTSFEAQANSFGSPALNTFYWIVCGYDSSSGLPFIQVNDGTLNTASAGTPHAVGTAEFRIGARAYAGFEDYFDGKIDNVNIWKRILTTGEKTGLYNAGVPLEYPF